MISTRTLTNRKRHLENIVSDEKVKPPVLAQQDTSNTTALNLTSTKSSRIQSNDIFPSQSISNENIQAF